MKPINNIYYIDSSLLLSDLYPLQFGEQACESSYGFGPSIRNHFFLHYIYHGQGIFQAEGKTYPLHAGQLFLIYPDQITYYEADQKDPWLYRWIEFHGSISDTLASSAGFSKASPVLSDTEGFPIGQALKRIVEQGEIDFAKHMSNFWYFISTLISRNLQIRQLSQQELYIFKAEKFIKTNLHRTIKISDLSDTLGIDRSYLSRLFKRYKGVSTQQFILSAKLDAAAQFLKNENFSIREVAQSVGYDDSLQFSKAFKAKFNLSPSLWRKEIYWKQSIKES